MKLTSKKDRKVTVRLSARDYERLQDLIQGESMSAFVRSAIHSEMWYLESQRRRDHMMIVDKLYNSENEKGEACRKNIVRLGRLDE